MTRLAAQRRRGTHWGGLEVPAKGHPVEIEYEDHLAGWQSSGCNARHLGDVQKVRLKSEMKNLVLFTVERA